MSQFSDAVERVRKASGKFDDIVYNTTVTTTFLTIARCYLRELGLLRILFIERHYFYMNSKEQRELEKEFGKILADKHAK